MYVCTLSSVITGTGIDRYVATLRVHIVTISFSFCLIERIQFRVRKRIMPCHHDSTKPFYGPKSTVIPTVVVIISRPCYQKQCKKMKMEIKQEVREREKKKISPLTFPLHQRQNDLTTRFSSRIPRFVAFFSSMLKGRGGGGLPSMDMVNNRSL